jgi:hypothetical protein
MTFKFVLITLAFFAVAHLIAIWVAFPVLAGFSPKNSVSTVIVSVVLFSLVWIVSAAVAFIAGLRNRSALLGLLSASLIWSLAPLFLEVSNLRGNGFSINLGGIPVVEAGQRTEFGQRLFYAQLVTRISSAFASLLYAYFATRRS